MTKYYSDKYRAVNNTDVPISLPNWENIDSREERYCPYCSLRLSRIIDSSGMNPNWYCSKCVINYPDKSETKSKSVISTPRKSNNESPPATTKFPESTIGRSPPPVRGTFAALQRRGIKITNYKDTVKS
jgi:hypothetical protein